VATATPDGALVVDKPAGWTSHDVVARLRGVAGTRKVGHAGTLDPMATGVLVVGVGRATRLLGYLSAESKAYEATIRLGQSTVTDDAEGGEIVSSADASWIDDEKIESALAGLRGDIMQVPSAVSAIKVDGRRAYARVRAGDDVELPARAVRVDELSVRDVRRVGSLVDVDVVVVCSSGTYVRALARDAGAALGVGGHLTALRRTRVGSFTLDDAHPLDELTSRSDGLPFISLADVAAATFPVYVATVDEASWVRNGRRLNAALPVIGSPVAVLDHGGDLLALYEQQGDVAKPLAVFP
jgi:tRNA pseudouridine55 synthase